MNLKSKIELTYETGVASQETGIVEGFIHRHEKGVDGVINTLFSYKTPEGDSIKTAWFPTTEAEADALYTAVEANLPDIATVGFSAWNEALFMEGFRVEMANTFGITVADIDVIA